MARYPDGAGDQVVASAPGTPISHSLRLRPGGSDLVLGARGPGLSNGADPRTLFLQVRDLQIRDAAVVGVR